MKILLLILALSLSTLGQNICTTDYTEIVKIVQGMGWKVTSTTQGKHNIGSLHPKGRAVDISVRDKTDFHVATLTEVLGNLGYVVRDERVRPKGQRVWSAPHVHVALPKSCK